MLGVDLEDLVPAFLPTLQPQHAILDFHGGLVPFALSETQVVLCQDDDVELPELRAFLQTTAPETRTIEDPAKHLQKCRAGW